MKKENTEDIKPDLKHDSMEYAASTDGDDILDMDTENEQEIEDEDITAQELELLEKDENDAQASALNSVETDRNSDDEVIFNENDREEEEAYKDEEDKEMHRK